MPHEICGFSYSIIALILTVGGSNFQGICSHNSFGINKIKVSWKLKMQELFLKSKKSFLLIFCPHGVLEVQNCIEWYIIVERNN